MPGPEELRQRQRQADRGQKPPGRRQGGPCGQDRPVLHVETAADEAQQRQDLVAGHPGHDVAAKRALHADARVSQTVEIGGQHRRGGVQHRIARRLPMRHRRSDPQDCAIGGDALQLGQARQVDHVLAGSAMAQPQRQVDAAGMESGARQKCRQRGRFGRIGRAVQRKAGDPAPRGQEHRAAHLVTPGRTACGPPAAAGRLWCRCRTPRGASRGPSAR